MNALERAASRGPVTAVVASMLGTQMLAMLPVAREQKLPLVTVSGTAEITQMQNPYVFRFFPGDDVTKVAHVRYAVEELGKRRVAADLSDDRLRPERPAADREHSSRPADLTPVFEDGLEVQIRDMSPVLGKAKAANPDVLLIHLHAGPTALLIRQAASMGLGIPIVAGSAMHQPPTAELLEPGELKGVCAEANASPVSGGSPGIERFVQQYRQEFGAEPDGFALGQYDGVMMVLDAVAKGARSAEDVRRALASEPPRRPCHDLQVRRDGQHGAFGADRLLRRDEPGSADRQALRQHHRRADELSRARRALAAPRRIGDCARL